MKVRGRDRLYNFIVSACAIACMWLVWVIAWAAADDGYVIPSFWDTFSKMFSLFASARFWQAFGMTLARTALSWAVSLAAAAAAAWACAASVKLRRFFAPLTAEGGWGIMKKTRGGGAVRIIISPAKMEEVRETDFLDRMLSLGIKVMYVPPLDEWKKDVDLHNQIRKIRIEDLLEREPIQIDMRKIASHIEGKRVLITGAAGSIGSEIMRQVASFNPYQLVLVDQAETPLHDIRLELLDHWKAVEAKTIVADIGNPSRMEDIFRTYRPQYIFHAAAYKHVPMMEDNVSESIQTNVAGTMILADLAVKYGAEKFVMVSTDKAVNPTNVMGCSKRICEIYVQSLAKKLQREGAVSPQFITTRFGNVLGSNGSVIPRFREQIEHGGPVTVTHPEIIRYFMTIPEACRLVLEAGSMGHGGEIYIFDMGKPVKILDLAKKMINLSGHPEIKIEFTGLRHGEKLYEELLNVKEQTQPTYHEKIMIASVREYDYDDVKERIARLVETSYGYDDMETVRAMKALVPEFISKNSCFERLDPPVSTS